MTTLAIARMLDARPAAAGWVARCPAHPDKRPSLSIREGRGGCTLLRCFAGCETDAIADALGLRLSDLFAEAGMKRREYARRRVDAVEIDRLVREEVERLRTADADATGFPQVAELARHRNEARRIVERRYDIALRRERPLWLEIEPHCEDPAWLMCVDAALAVVAADYGSDVPAFVKTIGDLSEAQDRVVQHARKLQRELAASP